MNEAQKVSAYISSLPDWQFVPVDQPYGHMGATLTDAVLQAGVSYKTVVEPRVNRLLQQHPEATTTSVFGELLDREGAACLLQWNGAKKIATLKQLIALLRRERIETEDELRVWLQSLRNLQSLQSISGIKDKTAHYLQILVGIQGIAVDRHLYNFLALAGVPCRTYDEARRVIHETAILLGIDPSDLDHSVWRYMSKRQADSPLAFCAKTV